MAVVHFDQGKSMDITALIILAAGFKELFNRIKIDPVQIYRNLNDANKNQAVSELKSQLLEIKFVDIKSYLETIITNEEITESSLKNLKDWYGKNSDGISTILSELFKHSNSPTFVGNPLAWKDNEAFKNVEIAKKKLRKDVEIYMENNMRHEVGRLGSEEVDSIRQLLREMELVNNKINELYDNLNRFYRNV